MQNYCDLYCVTLAEQIYNTMKFKVVIHKAEEGGYWAEVPALPGCVTQGETISEIEKNIREAVDLYIEAANDSVNNADELMELTY